MKDSEFWRDLAEQFRALPDPYRALSAEWHQIIPVVVEHPAPAVWKIPAANRTMMSIRLAFEPVARRGGPRINPKMDSLTGWLEALREFGIGQDAETGREMNPDGSVVAHIYRGTITQLCQASIDYCKYCESMALEKERLEAINEWKPEVPISSTASLLEGEAIAAQLSRFREQCRMTVEEIAEQIGVNPRSVFRHFSGESTPRGRHLAAYERVFSNRLKTKVSIRKTS